MQTHRDSDPNLFIDSLREKAAKVVAERGSEITAGKPDEPVLAEWKKNGVSCRKLPDDEHGILRISIGGGETPVPLEYCVFRGDHSQVVALLERALKALKR